MTELRTDALAPEPDASLRSEPSGEVVVPVPSGVESVDIANMVSRLLLEANQALDVEPSTVAATYGVEAEDDESDDEAEEDDETGDDSDDVEPEEDGADPAAPPQTAVEPAADTKPKVEEEQPETDDPRIIRFRELVEERLERARYTHALARSVLTPEELAVNELVERRSSVWVPASTFLATMVAAVAAVVLATRLHSDPSQVSGTSVMVVIVTVVLLSASFVTLLRSEVHFDRLRRRGRLVRTDVADAYETVRDAPRRLLELNAPHEAMVRVAGLLPTAERLVNLLVSYTATGGTKVKSHPAYERLIRMRAEIEALELTIEENGLTAGPVELGDSDHLLSATDPLGGYDGVGDFADLSDIFGEHRPAAPPRPRRR